MTAEREEWLIVAVAMGLALATWVARGTPSVGQRVDFAFTIVPADGLGTACASDRTMETYHCEFDQADKPAGSANLLRPFVTLSGEQVLLAGVFDGPELAEWLHISTQNGSTERVTVRCMGRWLGPIAEARIRWTPTSSWGSAAGLSAAVIERCSVAK